MSEPGGGISQHLDTILESDEQMVGRLPESLFRNYMLPALLGQGDEKLENLWLPVAGSWQRPIDVFDDETQEILFRVPALVGEVNLNDVPGGMASAYEVIMEAQRKMQTMPAKVGEEFLHRRIQRRVRPRGKHRENLRQWNWILMRYGYEHYVVDPYGDLKKTNQQSNTTQQSGGGNDKPEVLGYEEL